MSEYVDPLATAEERLRLACERRRQTDYEFEFFTALGWSILTCGIGAYYFLYQLLRRARDHQRRRVEFLGALRDVIWERAVMAGRERELGDTFDRLSQGLRDLGARRPRFRSPGLWLLLVIVAGGVGRTASSAGDDMNQSSNLLSTIVLIVIAVLLDRDLIGHQRVEATVEREALAILATLVPSRRLPHPAHVKSDHNYVVRILVGFLTLGIYGLWWTADLMRDGNEHFRQNWRSEDDVLAALNLQTRI